MSEKRLFPRLSRDWDIDFQMTLSNKSGKALKRGSLCDLGGGGFCFRSDAPCSPGSFFHFVIRPADSLKPMTGVALTAWTRSREDAFEIGARFVWVNWKGMDTQTAIAQYVSDSLSQKPS
jgi:hypothetical protein